MSTYKQLLYHIVFSTRFREPTLVLERRKDLFRYTWGIIRDTRSHLYRLNGVDDHVHILTSIHPSVALADFVRDIKRSSSRWMHEHRDLFPEFDAWQEGYAAFTHSFREKDSLIDYIKNQEAHHRQEPYLDELGRILQEAGLELEEKYLS
jgi:REP element-mobilizing transposase RayT